MIEDCTGAFDTIESAQEFFSILQASVDAALTDIETDLDQARVSHDNRRTQALELALYKTTQLSGSIHKSSRILNDLRTLRRLLFAERQKADVLALRASPAATASDSA